MEPPVFIVGTGRCGSTMMSNLVRMHPRLLSLSEFFMSLGGRAFTLREPDGERFWRLLSRLPPIAGRMLAKGPADGGGAVWLRQRRALRPADVPPILVTALPHLTRDYDALYDELGPFLRGGGRAPLGQHYQYLFEWLCRRFDRERVVERSGSSLLFVPALARLFEGAKFVHLYRDGRDAAISMQRHAFFRLIVRSAGLFERVGLDPYRPPFRFGTSRLYPPDGGGHGPLLADRALARRAAAAGGARQLLEPLDRERRGFPQRARPRARAAPAI
jgi:hypothetical protein